MATSSISYSYLSKKILDCEIPSKETFNTLSLDQQIEILKSCYNIQRKLLIKILEDKKNEQATIEIPNIQPPKRDKSKPSKLKLSELCPWLPKNYFSKIKADFTPHLEENKIAESITWVHLGYSVRESWVLDVYNKHKHQIGSNKWIVEECLKQKLIDRADNFRRRNKKAKFKVTKSNNQVTNSDNELEILNQDVNQNIEQDKEDEYLSDLASNENFNQTTIVNECSNDSRDYITPTFSSYNNTFSSYYTVSASSSDNETTNNSTFQRNKDRISNRTRQKCDTTFEGIEQNLENPVPRRIKKKDTLLPLSSLDNNIFASNDILKSNTLIKENVDRVSNRTRQKNDADFEKNPLPKRVRKEDTLSLSDKNNVRKVQKANTRSKAINKARRN
ncbi:829_t:CDS:2 [Dentiscutata erythropus]|uniref:829_t:CDS:1 n=1 Tax=Dentiscutata erythropus TaxID=1348616 RepID=A0A9N9CXC0_9GLOM|nr:829_t:CDS:2 [Dentiscutata erythropus]